MKRLNYAIVSPYQGTPLNAVSHLSFSRTAHILAEHRWIFALPEGANTDEIRSLRGDIEFRFFPPEFFVTKRAAQLFYMHPLFYENFSDFDYILIHQPDVYVFEDQLEYWINHMANNRFDYIGAPWLDHEWLRFARNLAARLPWHWFLSEKVGSGGFSIRNPKKFAEVSRRYSQLIMGFSTFVPEDIWWCQLAQKFGEIIRRPSVQKAAQFAFETQCERCLLLNNGRLPFAVHGWNRHDWDFWKDRIPDVTAIYNHLSYNGVRPM